jgi:hypothetical protein
MGFYTKLTLKIIIVFFWGALLTDCKSESKTTSTSPRDFEIYLAPDLPDKVREDLLKI